MQRKKNAKNKNIRLFNSSSPKKPKRNSNIIKLASINIPKKFKNLL
ncbi:hypothetical protein PT142_04710 (plasmid) [Borreliella garinii]|nr:hypothetical protein PT142_04710 [Borreliella garinii]